MKKTLIATLLGLSLLASVATVSFAQEDKKTEKKKKKGKKKGEEPKPPAR